MPNPNLGQLPQPLSNPPNQPHRPRVRRTNRAINPPGNLLRPVEAERDGRLTNHLPTGCRGLRRHNRLLLTNSFLLTDQLLSTDNFLLSDRLLCTHRLLLSDQLLLANSFLLAG